MTHCSLKSKIVREAAEWFVQHRNLERPFVPVLRERFGLTAIQAIEAGKLAAELEQQTTFGSSIEGAKP